MPNATVRANARALPEATPYPDAEIRALAAEFEAVWKTERAINANPQTSDKESIAANARTRRIVKKIVALSGTGISTMHLKARAFMWSEGCTDLEEFSPVRDAVSDPILVSLFRDLGADEEASR